MLVGKKEKLGRDLNLRDPAAKIRKPKHKHKTLGTLAVFNEEVHIEQLNHEQHERDQ